MPRDAAAEAFDAIGTPRAGGCLHDEDTEEDCGCGAVGVGGKADGLCWAVVPDVSV